MKNVAASRGKVNVPLSCEEKKSPTEGVGSDNKRAAAVALSTKSPKKAAHASPDVAITEPAKPKEADATQEGASATPSAQKRPAEKDLASPGKKVKGTPSAVEGLSPAEEKDYIDELARQLDNSTPNALVVAKPVEKTQTIPETRKAADPPPKPTGAVTSPEDLEKLQTAEAKEALGSWVPWSQRVRQKKEDAEKLLVDLNEKKDEKEEKRLERAAARAEKAAEKTQKAADKATKAAAKVKAKTDPKKTAKGKQEEAEPTSAAGLASKLKGKKAEK